MRRCLATLGVLASLALTVTACGGGGGGGGGASANGGSSSQVASATGGAAYGSPPPVGSPRKGGTIAYAQLTGQTPVEILPMTDSANTTGADFQLNGEMYLPLYAGPNGATPTIESQASAARPPSLSDGDRTVTIPLRRGLKWSDGKPVVADDVLFYIALLKAAIHESAANWAQYVPGQFPLSVTRMSAPNAHTVVLHLNRPYNPGYFLEDQLQDTDGGVYPLPSTDWNIAASGGPHLGDWRNPAIAKRIYDYLNKVGTSVGSFATDPLWKVVDGPFKLKDFNVTNGSYDLVPNPSYGLTPKPTISKLSVVTYTSNTAAVNALRSGTVDVAPLDASQIEEVPSLRSQGISVFGAPQFGWNAAIYNFEDKTDHFNRVIAQVYARQALAHLVDQTGIIKGIFKGTAVPAYGPVPSAPKSPYAPPQATHAPYPYDPAAAVSLLKSHGWKVVPGGQSTCAKPGTGAGECGAGIPAGTPFRFTWLTRTQAVSASSSLVGEAISSVAKQTAGIGIEVQTKTDNTLSSNYDDSSPAAAKYTDAWGVLAIGTLLIDYYPTQSGYDSPGSLDIGGIDDPTTNRLINASVHSGNHDAVEREAAYLTTHPPSLFLPNPDYLYAVGKGVGGPASSWLSITQGSAIFPQFWYRTSG